MRALSTLLLGAALALTAHGAPAPAPSLHASRAAHAPAAALAKEFAEAEATAEAAGPADALFTLSAREAVFEDATRLRLTGVAESVAFILGDRLGSWEIGRFVNPSGGFRTANEKWLDAPFAELVGHAREGALTLAFLNLYKPSLRGDELSFEGGALGEVGGRRTQVKSSTRALSPSSRGGLVELASLAARRNGTRVLTAPRAGDVLYRIELFISTNRTVFERA